MDWAYTGKILRVNLTDESASVENRDELFYRRYLGGVGFIGRILVEELRSDVDPLGPDNKLVFAAGPLTGMPLAGAARHVVGAKSPLSGGFGKGEVGWYWGAELKRAGFDAIIVEGRAKQPMYLWVKNGQVEMRDAGHLWGLETKECQAVIHKNHHDDDIRVAQIGPGGENLVRFACVIHDLHGAVGRTGMGAVMGSKNLKAVAVKGRQRPKMFKAEGVKGVNRWLAKHFRKQAKALHDFGTGSDMLESLETGNMPTRNWRDGIFEGTDRISAQAVRDTIRIGMKGCPGCPIRCKKIVRVREPYTVDPAYGGPEYETLAALGANCGIDDVKAIARAHHLCQANSLDTISMGSTIAFAMECFENGLLTKVDTNGMELTFGNAEAMLETVARIAQRDGIGDLLAEGSRRAAEKIGPEALQYAHQVKGVDMGMHEARLKPGTGLGYAVASHGGDHGTGFQDTYFDSPSGRFEQSKPLGIIEPLPASDLSPRKVAMFIYRQQWQNLCDSAPMCVFIPFSPQQIMQAVGAATGWSTSVWEGMKVGERAITLARAFNVIQGLTPDDDKLPPRMFQPFERGPLKGVALDPKEMKEAIRTYYKMMGWDPENGIPTPEKLWELQIEWVLDKL
ncbi:MAG: aldehyde ferredoxin oxidoreductase family protein [Gemmatimonadota bacterium]|nr:MAG: aldehyde ferredoxin oxidoreductase family protein [Gemmatimonadota bacterium]